MPGQALRKAPEQQRQDDAGVPPGTPQQSGSSGLGHLPHRGVVGQAGDLPLGGADGHGHVGAGVSIRHWEDVQRVYRLFQIGDIIGPGDKGIPKHQTMYHVQSTLPYLAAPNKIWAHSTRILLRFHSVNKYIHFFHLKAGGLLYGVADFVHDAFDNGGNVDAIGHYNVKLNGQAASDGFHLDPFYGHILAVEGRNGSPGWGR